MTRKPREAQIEDAALKYSEGQFKYSGPHFSIHKGSHNDDVFEAAFTEGAEWADANPEVLPDELNEKEFFEKMAVGAIDVGMAMAEKYKNLADELAAALGEK